MVKWKRVIYKCTICGSLRIPKSKRSYSNFRARAEAEAEALWAHSTPCAGRFFFGGGRGKKEETEKTGV